MTGVLPPAEASSTPHGRLVTLVDNVIERVRAALQSTYRGGPQAYIAEEGASSSTPA
jgi:hypothetical protein